MIHDALLAILASESELSVQRGLDAVVPDKTVVMIAHRLSTVEGVTGRWCRRTVGGRIRAVMPNCPSARAATGGCGRRRCGARDLRLRRDSAGRPFRAVPADVG